MTVTVCAAIVKVPVRAAWSAFCATVNVTVPSPVPSVGVTVMNAALLIAFQEQAAPCVAVIRTDPDPPAAANLASMSPLSVNLHSAAC